MNEVAIRVVIEKVKLDAKTTMSYTTTILKLSVFRNLKNSFFCSEMLSGCSFLDVIKLLKPDIPKTRLH